MSYNKWFKQTVPQMKQLPLDKSTGSGIIEKRAKSNYIDVVRYDVENNDFVKGSIVNGIATMFKPKRGAAYFHDKKRDEGGRVD